MIVTRATVRGEPRYQVRAWDVEKWKTIGTFGTLEEATEAERYAVMKRPKFRACTKCACRFRPKDDRRIHCPRCVKRASRSAHDSHWVYRAFDSADELLYVGVTSSGIRRFKQHGGESDWWPRTAKIEIEHCESREQALGRELELIHELAPPFNSVGKR